MSVAAALLVLLPALAPPDATIQGTVRAATTLEPIASATVRIEALGRAVATDEEGYFVFTEVPAGEWTLAVRALGYEPREVEVRVPEDGAVRVGIALEPAPIRLEGIEVTAEGEGLDPAAAAGPGATELEGPTIRLVPGVVQSDVLRAVQILPSVAAASDFSSAPYIRGGSPDQTLILLDGMPLFNPYHLGGLFSAFDPSAVESVDVLAGAFPARVGDRISGVISVQTEDGARDAVHGAGAVGLISSRAMLEGPLPGGRGSYLFTVRRTYLDLFTDAAQAAGLIQVALPYSFTDAYLKLTRDVGAFGRLQASAYVDTESLDFTELTQSAEGFDFGWGSRAASLSYEQPIGPTLEAEFRVAWSTFYGSFDWRRDADPATVPVARARTHMRDALAAVDLTWHRLRHEVRAGVQVDAYAFDYDIAAERETVDGLIPGLVRSEGTTTVAAYVEDEWDVSGSLRVRAGLRVLYATGLGTAWMPRLGARMRLTPHLSVSLGAGRYAQAVHSIKNYESGFSNLIAYDLLTVAEPAIGMPTAEDVVLGLEWQSGPTRLRLDVYAKRLHDLALAPLPPDPIEAPVLVTDGFREGEGSAYGLEIVGRHSRGGWGLMLAYALSAVEYRAGDDAFTPRFVRRHRLDLIGFAPLGDDGKFSVRLALGTGQPRTPVVGLQRAFEYNPLTGGFVVRRGSFGEAAVFGEHNSARLPGYLRLDVAARTSFEWTWFGRDITVTPFLQVINVLNTHNVLWASPDPFERGPQLNYTPQLPILPTFGVEWKF